MKANRFTPEQLAHLDAHFGEREVWLPMKLDDLVASLVEAQAVEVLSKKLPDQADTKARFMYDSSQASPSRQRTTKEEDMSASTAKRDLSALSAKLMEEVKQAFPQVELTPKKAYTRARVDGKTVAYLYPSPNGGKSAVETPVANSGGKYLYQSISNAAELKKALAAMKAVHKAQAKAAAKSGS